MTRTSSTLPGAPPARPSWLLLPKIVFVAVLFGSFVSVLVLILATPLESRADWQGLVDAVGTIFKIVIVPGSFVVVVFSVLLLIKHRRWFLKQRWAQVKVLLLVAALPASHLAARSVFSAIRKEVEQGSPEGPTGLLQSFTLLVISTILVLLVALWLARFKPRLGQNQAR